MLRLHRLRSMRAACCCMLGAWQVAVGDLEIAAELQPCASSHARLAEVRLQLGDYEGAYSALAAAQQADDAAECAELTGLKQEIAQRSNALSTCASGAQKSAQQQLGLDQDPEQQPKPKPEPEPEPKSKSKLEPEQEPEPEPRLVGNQIFGSPSLAVCPPCPVSREYRGSLHWAPDSVWPLPLRPPALDSEVPLTDWESALAARLPVGSVPSGLAAEAIDGLSFPYSLAWALRKLSWVPVDSAFHICVFGASAHVEQRLIHADDGQPGGYWVELLHLCRHHYGGKAIVPSLVVHLIGPQVTPEESQTVEVAGRGKLRLECHNSDAVSFIDDHPSLFQRSVHQSPDSKRRTGCSMIDSWNCLAVMYHSGFGTGDPSLLHSWLPALRRLVLLEVPTVCTCPNMVVDGAGEVAALTQALGARIIDLSADGLATPQATSNPFAGASLHSERDVSGLIDVSWRPNQFIYAFSGRLEGAGPMPKLEDRWDLTSAHKMGCSGLLCVANHALMFAKMRQVADRLR